MHACIWTIVVHVVSFAGLTPAKGSQSSTEIRHQLLTNNSFWVYDDHGNVREIFQSQKTVACNAANSVIPVKGCIVAVHQPSSGLLCAGIANPGYTPHVAAGSPIVTFQMQVKDNGDDDSVLFPLLPLIVLNSVYQPDLTAITLSIDSDDNADSSVLMAVAFNGLPKSNAVQAAANFAKKLNASATSSSMVPFVTPASVTIQDISDVRQQIANDGEPLQSLSGYSRGLHDKSDIMGQLHSPGHARSEHGSQGAFHVLRWDSL